MTGEKRVGEWSVGAIRRRNRRWWVKGEVAVEEIFGDVEIKDWKSECPFFSCHFLQNWNLHNHPKTSTKFKQKDDKKLNLLGPIEVFFFFFCWFYLQNEGRDGDVCGSQVTVVSCYYYYNINLGDINDEFQLCCRNQLSLTKVCMT